MSTKSFNSFSRLSKSSIFISSFPPPPPPIDLFVLSFINNSIPLPKLEDFNPSPDPISITSGSNIFSL